MTKWTYQNPDGSYRTFDDKTDSVLWEMAIRMWYEFTGTNQDAVTQKKRKYPAKTFNAVYKQVMKGYGYKVPKRLASDKTYKVTLSCMNYIQNSYEEVHGENTNNHKEVKK